MFEYQLYRDREQTQKFFVDAMQSLTPPKFWHGVTDADIRHKAEILTDYAWLAAPNFDLVAARILAQKQLVQSDTLPRKEIAAFLGSAALMLCGYYAKGLDTMGYNQKKLIRKGKWPFYYAAELETDPTLQRVYLQSCHEFDPWRRYFLRLHHAF